MPVFAFHSLLGNSRNSRHSLEGRGLSLKRRVSCLSPLLGWKDFNCACSLEVLGYGCDDMALARPCGTDWILRSCTAKVLSCHMYRFWHRNLQDIRKKQLHENMRFHSWCYVNWSIAKFLHKSVVWLKDCRAIRLSLGAVQAQSLP